MRRIDLASVLLALAASGCHSGTGGRPVAFTLTLAAAPGDSGSPGVFTNSAGWQVRLDEACVAVGPVYLWAGAGHLSAARGWRLPTLVRAAHAHPGDNHFAGGEVRGEWVSQVAFDLLAPAPRTFPALNGLAGPVRSFSVLLDPPRPGVDSAPCLRGHHAYAVGVAQRDGRMVPFEGGLDIENVGTSRRVDGLPLAGELDDGGHVVVTIHPAAWFDSARFETLDEKNEAGRFVITPDSQVRAAWFIGARGPRAFLGRITTAP